MIADAAIASHTPMTAFLDLPIMRFYDFREAIITIMKKIHPKKKK